MYQDLKKLYWLPNMKADISTYVSKCLTCAKVKAKHQTPSGLLQQPEIPEWKWVKITIDFVTGLPRTPSGYDLIWVIVYWLTKSAHFLSMKKTDSMEKLTQRSRLIVRFSYLIDFLFDHPLTEIKAKDLELGTRKVEAKEEDDEEIEIEDNDDKTDAEIIYPYEEADPLNRPPPSLEIAEDNAVRVDASSDHGGKGVDTTVVVKNAREEKDDKGDDADVAKDS
nr:putative reverse transcriptase domain-containing protein [Tanacetum cinerariifolium]